MTKGKTTIEPSAAKSLPNLRVPRPEAERQIASQIQKGTQLLAQAAHALEEAKEERSTWDTVNRVMLAELFDPPGFLEQYMASQRPFLHDTVLPPPGMVPKDRQGWPPAPGMLVEDYRDVVRRELKCLELINELLPYCDEPAQPSLATYSHPGSPLSGHLEEATDCTIVPFVSMSFDESDQGINDYVTGILKALQIDFKTGERYSRDSIPDKVLTRILASHLLIAVFVKRDKVEGGGYTAPPWLFKELGIAQGAQKDVIAWVERGIADIAGLDYEKEVIYFQRDNVKAMQKATMKFLEALKEHIPGVMAGKPAVSLDQQTREGVSLLETVQAMERGEEPSSTEQVTRLRKLFGSKVDPAEAVELASTLTVGHVSLILIPAAEFTMGEGSDARQVRLDAFYIGKYPITNAEYGRFVEATVHRGPDDWLGAFLAAGKENYPAVRVSWSDACAYCQWLAEETGWVVRLPTEAEWEKAARGTDDQRKWPWGDEFADNRCNTWDSGIGHTTPVGKYSPQGDSPYGVVDMAGNVWERTSSLHWDYPYNADDGREESEAEGFRVVRGGCFADSSGMARVSFRYGEDPDTRDDLCGFRAVLLPPDSV